MTLPAEWIQYARRFGLAAVWLVALTIWQPVLGLASLLLIAAGAVLGKSPVFGVVLAAAAAPFGLWLLEHPGAAAVAICAVASWALVWFHRAEIRREI